MALNNQDGQLQVSRLELQAALVGFQESPQVISGIKKPHAHPVVSASPN